MCSVSISELIHQINHLPSGLFVVAAALDMSPFQQLELCGKLDLALHVGWIDNDVSY